MDSILVNNNTYKIIILYSYREKDMRTILIILGILLCVNLLVVSISKAFAKEQNINMQIPNQYNSSNSITYNGITMSYVDWDRIMGFPIGTVYYRIMNGYPVHDALMTPAMDYHGNTYIPNAIYFMNNNILINQFEYKE